jgi:hypothetical protein
MGQVRLGCGEVERELLPAVCMRCGAAATAHKIKRFSWYPPWVNLLILVAWPACLIVALILTKRMRVSVPLCDRHRNHWLIRLLFASIGFAVIALTLISGLVLAGVLHAQRNSGTSGDSIMTVTLVGTSVLFLGWLIGIIILQSTAIRPAEITDRSITLAGVSPAFVDALDSNYSRRDEDEDEDEDENEYDRERPRRRRSEHLQDPDVPRRRSPPDAYRESDD